MSQSNGCDLFWSKSIDQRGPVTQEQIETIRQRFNVAADLREVKMAPGYIVSEDGRVFSCLPCSWKQKECPRECKVIPNTSGYLMIRLHVAKKPSAQLIHRLVAMAFLDQPQPHQKVVRHLDGNHRNNHASNLAWGTQKENLQDAIRHGRTRKGMKNSNAKITDRVVVAVRILHEEGFSVQALAAFVGLNPETTRRMINKTTWGHVHD